MPRAGTADDNAMGNIMKRVLLSCALTVVTLSETGSSTPEQDVARAGGICAAGGIAEGTPQFRTCVSTEVAKMQDDRAQMGAALAAGLQSYGRSQAAYQSSYRHPVY